jgi:hypothetical protein
MLKPGININIIQQLGTRFHGYLFVCLFFVDAPAATWWNQCPRGRHPNIGWRGAKLANLKSPPILCYSNH